MSLLQKALITTSAGVKSKLVQFLLAIRANVKGSMNAVCVLFYQGA